MDWYPWGDEAFETARRENKPVFLSIGYSTCHWCHVMEDESFSDAAIAQSLNRHFVPIKVDREERPDIDKIYMSYVIAVTGSGGWPMTVFLTPDAKPFYGGTYFPPEDRYGRPGLPSVIEHIAEAWKSKRDEVFAAGERAVALLVRDTGGAQGKVRAETLHAAWRQFASGYDEYNGGFGSAPKFPTSHALSFLMRFYARTGESTAREIAVRTLERMARGGIHDHLGGGFHRYSVDAMWRVPHFEKMLYDQAMLLRSYAEAFALTGDAALRETAVATAEYVLSDLADGEGAFYSAEDADSPDPDQSGRKREGAFYVWKKTEIDIALGKDAEIFSFLYGVEEAGNAPSDPHAEFTGRNILHRARTDAEAAERFARPAAEIADLRRKARARLTLARSRRPKPHLDDKILADWNGLMIGSLAYASGVLDEPRWAAAAGRAADFVLARMSRPGDRLWHRYRAGEAAIAGQLDDYAFLLSGLLDLYEATFDERRLREATALADAMIAEFWDAKAGGFFMSAEGSDKYLITRPKESSDSALPSGNSMAALGLLRLHRLTGDKRFEEHGTRTLQAFAEAVGGTPTGFAQMLQAFDFALGPVYEIVLAGDPAHPEMGAMIREARTRYIPSRVLMANPPGPQKPLDGRPTAYVCRDRVCDAPAAGLAAFKAQIGKLRFNTH